MSMMVDGASERTHHDVASEVGVTSGRRGGWTTLDVRQSMSLIYGQSARAQYCTDTYEHEG